jgi:hypothetical protein
MVIFRLVTIMFRSKFILLYLFIARSNLLEAQISENTTSQIKSPNANIQIGSENVNKSTSIIKNDNRKVYNTNRETSNEVVYTGPLITGDNPYITINNISPNIDSIKYEIALKKKNIRIALSRFMLEANNLQTICSKDTSLSTFTELEYKYKSWREKVFNFLSQNLDESYAVQFVLSEIDHSRGPVTEMPKRNSSLWRELFFHSQRLDKFVTSLY